MLLVRGRSGAGAAWSVPESRPGQLSGSERWILQKVGAGEVADLKEHFGEEEQLRQVRAGFLVKLLTEGGPGVKIPYQGVRISQAIITGTLDLENAEVEHWLELLDCRFQGEINLRDSFFQKGVDPEPEPLHAQSGVAAVAGSPERQLVGVGVSGAAGPLEGPDIRSNACRCAELRGSGDGREFRGDDGGAGGFF